jgi:hypothetical protein
MTDFFLYFFRFSREVSKIAVWQHFRGSTWASLSKADAMNTVGCAGTRINICMSSIALKRSPWQDVQQWSRVTVHCHRQEGELDFRWVPTSRSTIVCRSARRRGAYYLRNGVAPSCRFWEVSSKCFIQGSSRSCSALSFNSTPGCVLSQVISSTLLKFSVCAHLQCPTEMARHGNRPWKKQCCSNVQSRSNPLRQWMLNAWQLTLVICVRV